MLFKIFKCQIFLIICCIPSILGSCFYDGQFHEEGKPWNSSCDICNCHSNAVTCTKMACPAVSCKPGEVLTHTLNECCPQCIPYKRPCDVDSTKYEHNDVWQSNSKCIFYQCQDGFSIPFLIQCPSLVCSKDERLFTSPGKCCPKCVPLKCDDQNKDGDYSSVSSSGCLQNISYNQSCEPNADIKKQPANLFWQNPCTFCVTENGEINCYSQKCPACSSQFLDNNLCCSCPQESCAEDCLKCSDNDTSFCTYCKESSKVIHNGKCQADCPKSYFKNENMLCESCPQTCKTCFGNMSSQCSSCKSGYFLQKGHCVKSCGINFYEFDGYCLECHESCSSCIGPSDEDCIGCALSGQLLKNGKCVDDCDGHFYVADGYCLACNESCIRCLKNGSCQYCGEGFYLQDGLCLPDCLPGFYTFLNAYCMPCHEECQECFGPLPYQCISCPFNQYFLENSCVSDCGQGYFGDLGAGVCRPCHPDCRACLGGSSNDRCLSCSSGYLLPYIGTLFGSCVEKCPDEYYLMDSGICGTCFETCHKCFGPNDTECITCNSTLFFKNGACVPHCSAGYFEDGGICYACHPSCATCYGFGESECVTCPPGRKFRYGQCVSVCEEGKYMNSDNTCIDCHPSCIDCILSSSENKTVQCIKCHNQQFSILKDECIPECSSDLYLNSYHICTECHPSCATCERTGATSCASCLDGSFLTHIGTCESQCHLGYFSSNGICEPCNSDCHECKSHSKCLKCKGDLVLQYGNCVTACTEEFYLDTVTRQCKECSPECKSCRGPLLSDCLSCVTGKLFEDGVCVYRCSDGFFQDGNLCKTCDLKCRTCSDLNKCTSCDYPLLFLKNECVDDCGGGFYSDFETLTCEACSIGCASCISSDHCTLCYSGFYLMNFECVVQCPPEYYEDTTWRICEKNTDVPVLHTNSILKFPPGRKILISASFLSASDADSNFLIITISQQPDNGFLLKMSNKGNEIKLSPGENFTSSELKDGWVFFKHLQGIPLNGEVLLRVSDGHFSSNEVILPLNVSSTFPPVIEHIKDIVLTENSVIVLNSSFFSINDPDNSKDIILQVIEGPCSGKLVLLPEEKEVLSFSYEEFLQNRFALKSFQKPLKHDDKFILQISDGFNSIIAEIRVFVLPEEQKQLFLMRNNTFLVKYEELSKLTNDYLLVIGENLSPTDIVFTVEKSSVIPFGNFFKSVINSKKKKKISSGKISFTQEDLNQGLISYKHLDNTTTNFVINMKASSAKSKVVLNFDFEIQVLTYDDALVIPEETNQFGMMVLQNHPATITNDHLQIPLNGISAENIIYMITKKLAKDEGFLESLDKPGYRLQSFTQKDVDNLKIVYHPPPYSEGSEVNYVFQFVVLDKRRNVQLSPVQNFTITVRPQSTEFTSPSSSIDHETDIIIPQGQTVELGSHWLSTVGHEIPEDQLEVVLNIAPQHGNLSLKIHDGFIEIEEEDGYSFTSVIHDTYYTHDGSNKFKDFAVFKIMGGQYTSLNRVNFIISPNDRESPVILDSTSLMGTVIEGKYLDLRRDHLAYTDLVSGDHDIVFALREEPKFGTLNKLISGNYYAMEILDTFTQEDINNQMIRYMANDNIGNNAQKDFLSFDVSDGSGNVQPNQVLTMKVKPKKRSPPVVKVTSDVKVNEGGEAILESHVINVSDPDSPLSDLIAYIEKQPDYGFLENSRPIPGAEHSLAGIPISSFSYVDLVEGYIKYLQIEHRDVEPERDTLYIRVSDGYLSSPSHLVNITIKPINDEAPVVHTDHLLVLQGGFVKISNSTLSVSDGDTSADQLIITLDNPPQKGEIRLMTSNTYNFKNSKPLLKQGTFTFQDVLNGLIMYVHGVSKSHDNDAFSLSVSDGHHIISASMDVFVIVKDREVPYLVRNLGLEIMPGDSIVIDNKTLNANDSDSAAHLLRYLLISDPSSGELFIILNGKENKLSSHFKNSGMNTFTQDDIDKEIIFYRHNVVDPVGLHYFRFNVIDPANNTLLDQKFFISISEDLFPPVIINNTGLSVEEKTSACLNSSILAAVDEHQKDKDLIFSLSSLPFYGFLGMKHEETKPISTFLMSDLKDGRVCYVHKSDRFTDIDSFTFTVSDGKNYVHQAFRINITHSYNAFPFVKLYPLFIEEGASKIITEFEIDIFDKDSSDSTLTISVISPPNHGTVIHSNGTSVNHFSVKDIKQGHISYVHDDSDTVFDSLAILVTDGLNDEFIFNDKHGKNVTTKNPVIFPIKVYPVDDTFPVLLKNEPLEVLKIDSGKIWNTISENLLYAEDADTEKENIVYRVTLQPHLGSLELASIPDVKIFQFSQKDIENGELQYVMKNDDFISVVDNFMFSVEDTKPNKLFNNVFAMHWSRIHFLSSEYNISETSGLLELTIRRIGNKLLDFIAYCTVENADSHHRITDSLITVVNEVHFKENEIMKFCIFKVVDNNIFEGMKQFKIVLKSDLSLLASPHTAVITITDKEDEPVISFKDGLFKINETGEFFNFPVIRKGDLEQELSVLCTTSDLTAQGSNASSLQSGSDYRSRDSSHNSLITFDSGVSEVMCSVKIIDDNLYEEEEEFLISLSNPHPVGRIENFTKAHVVINGPNDAPYIFIQDPKTEMFIGDKNSSVIVVRQGVDISGVCSVWCGSSISLSDRNEEEMNTFYQIVFQPFETTAVCSVKTDSVKHNIKTIQPTMTIFLDSPSGCLMGKPNRITVTLKEKIIYPVIEFMENYITVLENVGSVLLRVLRTGDTSSSATLHCFTEDGTAHAREDFEERYRTRRNSRIHFSPGQKESFCPLKIYDDEMHEGSESFLVHLSPLNTESEVVTIGTKKSMTVEIVDSEDVTVVELDQSHYLVTQNSSPNSSASAIISVVRHGDVSLLSKVRISTIDGSASSGLDYYAKSKLFSFHPGEKKKTFEIEILYNRRRNWALSFTVILGPDEVINAEIGNKSKAIVTIPRVQSTESLILPSVPIVVSLMHYNDVKNGMNQDAKSGYPLVCITPCDVNYPDYAVTSGLCRESGINISSLSYSWEIAMPLNSEENMSPFEKITDSTLFTSAYNRVLDSVYFRPHEKVRCIAQPRDSNGNLGIPLRSKPIKISSESGFCLTPSKMQHLTSSISSQPFIATLNYINSSDAYHPNKLNIHVEIPHEDGLLPLLSTYPLHNVDFLLKQNVYRQQHVCSNLLHTTQRSFLKSLQPQPKDLRSAFPYHGEQVTKEMQLIYQHLDLKKCKWSFDAWYSMSDLVDLCGGTIVPDFKARDADKTFISVLLPFYVTYIFSSAPTGWISIEHRTEIEFSFYYDTFLWKAGSHADASFNASLSIVRIGTDASGHLFFEFKTVAKFYGCFVLEHNTLPGIKSYITVPPNLNVKFNLQLLWSEQSFDGPTQYWKATSNYNLKDYSGLYSVHLIPCEVSHTEQFSLYDGFQFLPCIAQTPQKFDLPISFQQTLRPEQVVYALETFFQIFNDENLFLLNPFENYPNFQYTEYKGAFSKGENVYGRVFWSPKQELESAYELKINEVLLCTGKNGFVPLYDPTGKIYGKGPQYGCLILNKNLKHKFILLDRHNPEAINTEFQGLPFEAKFIEISQQYTTLSQVPGVDGFVFKTDPLYEVSSSNQWFLQVTYSIKPTHAFRNRRSLEGPELLPVKEENQTYIRMIFLKTEGASQSLQQSNMPTHQSTFGAHYVLYLISGILIVIGIAIIGYRHPRVAQNTSTKVLDKYTWMRFNTKVCSNTRSNCYKVVECKQKIRQTEKCKIRIYSPKNELPYVDTTSGTEV